MLLLPVAFVILTSGCTVPGLPFFGGETAYENDVVIIRSLDAFPTTATSNQPITLVAYVQNVGKQDFDGQKTVAGKPNTVDVSLYDYCDGLFRTVRVKCPDDSGFKDKQACSGITLLRQETKAVEWTLTPSDVKKLATPCDLKVSVNYPYKSTSVTSVSFISQQEYKRQLQEGKFTQKTSSKTLGDGPLKASWTVQTPQPVVYSSGGSIAMMLDVQNRGRGFVRENTFTITESSIESDSGFTVNKDKCAATVNSEQTLVQGKRSVPCEIEMKQMSIATELTKQFRVGIEYTYEFRSQKRVEVVPPAGA